jgi:hypothetical protein
VTAIGVLWSDDDLDQHFWHFEIRHLQFAKFLDFFKLSDSCLALDEMPMLSRFVFQSLNLGFDASPSSLK